MLRLRRRTRVALEAIHTREVTDLSGGVFREEEGAPFTVEAVLLRHAPGPGFGEAGALAEGARYVLIEKGSPLRRHDRVTLPGVAGRLAVFEIRELPRHAKAQLREAP